MSDSSTLYLGGGSDGDVDLRLRMANRHGLIAGATGTGKTVTLQVLAENFSRAGVPVFVADVKGDLAGLVKRGREPESMVGAMAKSAARAIGSQIGRQIVRGVLGSLLGGGTRRR